MKKPKPRHKFSEETLGRKKNSTTGKIRYTDRGKEKTTKAGPATKKNNNSTMVGIKRHSVGLEQKDQTAKQQLTPGLGG